MKLFSRSALCILGALCFILPGSGKAQEVGIHFESGLSWPEIQTKAKRENKFIFLDCYATWCAPCKFMTQNIFPQKEVGEFMNEHFICVSLQVDQTANDNEEIRKWYDVAKSLSINYSINTLPTYLFFSPEGEVVHRIIGATGPEPRDFIAKVSDAINPSKQYYTLLANYNKHREDSAFLRNTLRAALDIGDEHHVATLSKDYLKLITDPSLPDNLKLVSRCVQSTSDSGFRLLLQFPFKVDSLLDRKHFAERKVAELLMSTEIDPLFANTGSPLDWDLLAKKLQEKYPGLSDYSLKRLAERFSFDILDNEIDRPLYAENAPLANWKKIERGIRHRYLHVDMSETIALEKPRYFNFKKMWPACERSVLYCLNKYGNQLDRTKLNALIWDYLFFYGSSKKTLAIALDWSRRTLPDSTKGIPFVYNADTYANLLYKMYFLYKSGAKSEAISWEEKAFKKSLEISSFDDAQINCRITLERMRKGEMTWEGRKANGYYE